MFLTLERLRWLAFVCGWGLLLGNGHQAFAHPFHISTAEMEYDAQTDRLQVSLKLQAVDLERALARSSGKRIDIEDPQAQYQIVDFLSRNIYFDASRERRPSPELAIEGAATDDAPPRETRLQPRSRVRWVGQELKGAWLWLYFELELPRDRQALQLFNTVLFDSNSSQINTVSIRHGVERTTLKMTLQQPSASFETKWLKRN